MILVDDSPVGYRNGLLRLETSPLPLRIAEIEGKVSLLIIDIRAHDIIIGHDWLRTYNPEIDWDASIVTLRRRVKGLLTTSRMIAG